MSSKPVATWFPSEAIIKNTHLYQWMQQEEVNDYASLHEWSCKEHAQFLEKLVTQFPIIFDKPFSHAMDLSQGPKKPIWFKNGMMNIANSCFQGDPKAIAIIEKNEMGRTRSYSYIELDILSNQIASAIAMHYAPKSRFAIIMPMTIEAIAIHLGIIKAGCTTIAIAESFSIIEIKTRLNIASATAIFVQDKMHRNQKEMPLYNHLVDQITLPMIVIASEVSTSLKRSCDQTFENFLTKSEKNYWAVSCQPNDYTTILFSSGTTGEPKAIPWTHATPIKCASDAYFHHDLKPGDRFLWPTSLGWMMGAWLIYAVLINKATIAIFDGTPINPLIGKFIEEQAITHVGVVPTVVKSWRTTQCMERFDWSCIKLFTSTAECSNADDMQYLMTLAGNKPMIEYCGGTEIAGAYITSTLLTPLAPAAFTVPAMGMNFLILDEEGNQTNGGEVFLLPPALGLSTELLNSNHETVYYADLLSTEKYAMTLRRHGDLIEHFDNGFYQLLGRADDTMNISGIKISCVEIERLLMKIAGIKEVAAIGINPLNGGPSLLIIFVVQETDAQLEKNALKTSMQSIIKDQLNPLFKISDVEIMHALPRTASNKIMRRILKKQYEEKMGNNKNDIIIST